MKRDLEKAKEIAKKLTKLQNEEEAFKKSLFKGNKGDKFYKI